MEGDAVQSTSSGIDAGAKSWPYPLPAPFHIAYILVNMERFEKYGMQVLSAKPESKGASKRTKVDKNLGQCAFILQHIYIKASPPRIRLEIAKPGTCPSICVFVKQIHFPH